MLPPELQQISEGTEGEDGDIQAYIVPGWKGEPKDIESQRMMKPRKSRS